ncbi:hypothetical protein [Legionella quateirensis]|uniref:Lipoprotein n=1 Tax=Legionella quateirensis TaxID=45072 RepID=A0A378KSZ2_9GAMM|nr:hypothetical protein [Legionella quateirensis]KTD55335.1 hypothetical protein Lqua_0052 [Legionella quateirensis]STY16508.1 Uncharacterised protein [Legionella quateirensis]
MVNQKVLLLFCTLGFLVSCTPLTGVTPSSASGSTQATDSQLSSTSSIKLKMGKKFTKYRAAQRRAVHRAHGQH